MLKLLEPVTLCDQFDLFFMGQLKHKIDRESFEVTFNRLVERFGWNTVKGSEIGVQHYLVFS